MRTKSFYRLVLPVAILGAALTAGDASAAIGRARAMSGHSAAVIIVSTAERRLQLLQAGTLIRSYPIAVGKPGLQWSGTHRITAKRKWPSWSPTAATRRHRRWLPRFVAGGPKNPLGARALYLGSSMYRIHGTNDPRSIGRAASLGCFRMHNADVMDLYERVPLGTRVLVRH